MRTVYEATQTYTNPFRQIEREFDTKDAATAFVNEVGSGRVITWVVYPNLPGLLPAERYQSCSLDVCNAGVWKPVYIHG